MLLKFRNWLQFRPPSGRTVNRMTLNQPSVDSWDVNESIEVCFVSTKPKIVEFFNFGAHFFFEKIIEIGHGRWLRLAEPGIDPATFSCSFRPMPWTSHNSRSPCHVSLPLGGARVVRRSMKQFSPQKYFSRFNFNQIRWMRSGMLTSTKRRSRNDLHIAEWRTGNEVLWRQIFETHLHC